MLEGITPAEDAGSCFFHAQIMTNGVTQLNVGIPQANYTYSKPVFLGPALKDYVCLAALQEHNTLQFCPNTTIVRFDTSHWIMLEKPNELNEALVTWLKEKVHSGWYLMLLAGGTTIHSCCHFEFVELYAECVCCVSGWIHRQHQIIVISFAYLSISIPLPCISDIVFGYGPSSTLQLIRIRGHGLQFGLQIFRSQLRRGSTLPNTLTNFARTSCASMSRNVLLQWTSAESILGYILLSTALVRRVRKKWEKALLGDGWNAMV